MSNYEYNNNNNNWTFTLLTRIIVTALDLYFLLKTILYLFYKIILYLCIGIYKGVTSQEINCNKNLITLNIIFSLKVMRHELFVAETNVAATKISATFSRYTWATF